MFSKPLNWILAAGTVFSIGSFLLIQGIVALYFKNVRQQQSVQPLSKQQLINILKLVRKYRYAVYKQIVTLAINISRQMRNINSQMIEQLLTGVQSPIKIKQEFDNIQQRACRERNTTIDAFYKALQIYEKDEEILRLKKSQEDDYRSSINGRLPTFQVTVPATFTKDRFIEVQNCLTKKTYLHQVAILNKMSQYTEQELQSNPQLLSEFSSHQGELEEILVAEGLGSEFEPAFAVYEKVISLYQTDPIIRTKIAKIEQGYQKIMMKYAMKIQNKTIRPDELVTMEEEIVWFDPLSV